jgi:glycosyltransferase involved in cell wall biosynthesis
LQEAGAVVVPPEQPRALADALLALAEDPERRQRMGVAGRAYVREHFDRATLARRYLVILGGQA